MPDATIDRAELTLSSCTGAVMTAPASRDVDQSLSRRSQLGDRLADVDGAGGLVDGDLAGRCDVAMLLDGVISAPARGPDAGAPEHAAADSSAPAARTAAHRARRRRRPAATVDGGTNTSRARGRPVRRMPTIVGPARHPHGR
jgi:hypothetical protein